MNGGDESLTATEIVEQRAELENYIDITDVDIRQFVKDVYALSQPQGMGFLHYKAEPLNDVEVDEILRNSERADGSFFLSMDYINGRSCKMHVRTKHGRRLISKTWYDHGPSTFWELLHRSGIDLPIEQVVEFYRDVRYR